MHIMPINSNKYNNNPAFGNVRQIMKKNLAVPLVGLSALAITSCGNVKNDSDVLVTKQPKIEQKTESNSDNSLLGFLAITTALLTGGVCSYIAIERQQEKRKKVTSELRQKQIDALTTLYEIKKENTRKEYEQLIQQAGPKPSFDSDLKSQLDWIQLRYKKDAFQRVLEYRELSEKLREQERWADKHEVDDILDVLECNLGGTRGG